MSHKAACPKCNKTLILRDEHLGKKVKCPKCGHAFLVESRGGEPVQEKVEEGVVEHLPDAPLLPPDKDFVYGFKDEPEEKEEPKKRQAKGCTSKRARREK